MTWENRRVFRGGEDERKGELFSKRKMGKIIAMNFANIYGGTGNKEPDCQCRRRERCSFDLWVRKIPWRRAWQPNPVFLPGEPLWTEEPGGLQSMGLQRIRHDRATKHSTVIVRQSF